MSQQNDQTLFMYQGRKLFKFLFCLFRIVPIRNSFFNSYSIDREFGLKKSAEIYQLSFNLQEPFLSKIPLLNGPRPEFDPGWLPNLFQ